jgi:opacity protein-like surface antigen
MQTSQSKAVHRALFLAICVATGAGKAVVASESDSWQFEVTPYFLAAGLDGTVGLRGVTADIDASFDDIWDNFDSGFMALFEAQKGPWIFMLEGVYFKLADEGTKNVTGPFGNVSVSGALEASVSMSIYQGSVGYRVLDDNTKVDLIGALRYTSLDLDLDATTTGPGIVFPGGSRSASGSESWTDVVVGARVLHPFADNWTLAGYADIGAGGSDLTYQFMAGVNWEFSPRFTAKAGYRYLSWDYEDGGTVWDVSASGPYLGLGIAF